MAGDRTDTDGTAGRGHPAQRDREGDRNQRGDDLPPCAHWAQYTLDNGPVNTCDGKPWVEPVAGAPTCLDCAAAAAQQLKGH